MEPTRHHRVAPIDENHLLYGNFIGLQYAFAKGLDAEILTRSIVILTKQFPALSGKYEAKFCRVASMNRPNTLKVQKHPKLINNILDTPHRPKFISEPGREKVLRGKAPLSTFTLTEFSGGGAIFGIAISHLLTDAAGLHRLVNHLADIYSALQTGKAIPESPFVSDLEIFDFGTQISKTESLNLLKQRGLPKPIPIKGIIGKFIKSLIIKAMDKSIQKNAPIRLHFSSDDVSRLKQTVLTESGENWISTNTALCAHFTSLIAKLSYGDDIKYEMQIGQLLDLRNRYFESDSKDQSNYIGNAILIHIDKAAFTQGLQNTDRGALARYFTKRQTRISAEDIKERLNLLANCLRHGYTNPELDVKNPIISLNNQSKMPVYDVQFGGQSPLRIYPQDVGDNIMFFPAPDGGIDIHIRDIVNPMAQETLLSPKWQQLIFNF